MNKKECLYSLYNSKNQIFNDFLVQLIWNSFNSSSLTQIHIARKKKNPDTYKSIIEED